MTSARRYYRFTVSLGAISVLTLLGAMAAVLFAVSPTPPALSDFADACRQFVPVTSWPAILVLVITSLGVTSGVCGSRTVLHHTRSQRRLMRSLGVLDRLHVAGVSAEVFRDARAQAFCAGLLRPRIYLSSGALGVLDADELRAILAHEDHHARRRDPLRILLAWVLRDTLFFLPIMRHVADRYGALAEMAADEAAVRSCGDRGALASAMLTFDERAPAGTVGIAPERVEHLLGRSPRWQLSVALLAAAAATLAVVGASGVATAAAAPHGGISIAVLVVQVCMLAMAIAPVLGAAALLLTIRFALAHART